MQKNTQVFLQCALCVVSWLCPAAATTARKERSGSPEIALDLQDQGQNYNRKTVAASMKRQGLRAKAAKKFKATTNSKHFFKDLIRPLNWAEDVRS